MLRAGPAHRFAGRASRRIAGRHVVEQDGVGSAGERLIELVERVHLDFDRRAGRFFEATRATAAGSIPPAIAMWLSLMSTASNSPKRWLVPPPQRTAWLSSARSPGAVLRVSSSSHAGAGDRVGVAPGGGGDARAPLQQVERRPLAGEDRPGVAAHDGDGAGRVVDELPVGGQELGCGGRVERAKHVDRGVQPADDAGRAHHDAGLGRELGRDDRVGGDVAAADVLGEPGVDQRASWAAARIRPPRRSGYASRRLAAPCAAPRRRSPWTRSPGWTAPARRASRAAARAPRHLARAGVEPHVLAQLRQRRSDVGARGGATSACSSGPPRPASTARCENTKHSSSELDARRLAPCAPVRAHSPLA